MTADKPGRMLPDELAAALDSIPTEQTLRSAHSDIMAGLVSRVVMKSVGMEDRSPVEVDLEDALVLAGFITGTKAIQHHAMSYATDDPETYPAGTTYFGRRSDDRSKSMFVTTGDNGLIVQIPTGYPLPEGVKVLDVDPETIRLPFPS